MATLIIPGHDRDALVTVLFPGLPADLCNPLVWTVQCAGCGDTYAHVEGVHDGFCDDCEADYTEQCQRELSAFVRLDDVVGYDDARDELNELAVSEWAAAERDEVDSMPPITVAEANAEVAAMIQAQAA
jgi:hypothetical protein